MKFLWTVLAASLTILVASIVVPGLRPGILLAAPCVGAAAILLLTRYRGGRTPAQAGGARPPRRRPSRHDVHSQYGGKSPSYVVVDGSNVMHWGEDAPSLRPVLAVLENLESRGFTPGVIFDANAGYKLLDSYQGAASFAALLGLPHDRVFVVPKGTQADLYILESARQLHARVVTNDRYRDWQEQYPEVGKPDFLIHGGDREGITWLGLGAPDPAS